MSMVGDVLAGRYELEELVGSGGMSSVYRAHDRVLERKVALKVLHPGLVGEHEYVERFRREAQMVAGLVHQNIVTVIDRGEDESGLPFIVFELVAGEDLKQLVRREGPLPLERALELAIQVARGLAFAHANGYVHRDVKPQNVLLNGNGEAKVTDFGIARSLDLKQGMTQTGTVVGTSDYIAPEQAQGQRVDEHTDVYSHGIVLYELLTGEVPFTGENFITVAMKHINEPPPPLSAKRRDVSPRLDAAVMRALSKRAEDRFATMAAFGQELEACLQELRSPGTSETVILPPPRARRRMATRPAGVHRARRRPGAGAVLVVLGLLAAVAALTVALLRHNGSPSSSSGNRGGGTPVALRAVASPSSSGPEHPERLSYATDGNASTYWETHTYRYPNGGLGKPGVGLVLDASRAVTLNRVTVTTDTPGFVAEIQAGDASTGPFHAVSSSQTVAGRTTFDLSKAKGRYFELWITRVPAGGRADVNEVTAT
jgi:serine/threonine protein kinase